ncbi:MAG: DUF4097 family beta strand repeat-containing protein [Dehalococcoidia bacterium]
MSDQALTLDLTGITQLNVTTSSGNVTVIAEDRTDLLIESGAPDPEKIERYAAGEMSGAMGEGHASESSPKWGWRHHHAESHAEDGLIHFHSAKRGSANLVMRCPTNFGLIIGSASGDVGLEGTYGKVKVTTASGRIDVDAARELDLRSVSGSIRVGRCEGTCRLSTVSGKTEVGSSEDTEASSISGKIQLTQIGGGAKVRSVSGSVEINTEGKGKVAVQTVSGSVRVEVPEGSKPDANLSSMTSRPSCECPKGNDFEIKIKSMSGKIDVVPH